MANRNVTRAVRLALIAAGTASVGAFAPGALAQEAELEQIVVTGSRIARPDYESASPVVSVSQQLFQQSGSASVDTVINALPQFVPSITSTSNNPSNAGQSNIDLRGLGSNRVLVLMDGRRVVPANGTGTVDLNLLPSSLIQNVEIISGGASAVYGSDAISGVVNFKPEHRFRGPRARRHLRHHRTGRWQRIAGHGQCRHQVRRRPRPHHGRVVVHRA